METIRQLSISDVNMLLLTKNIVYKVRNFLVYTIDEIPAYFQLGSCASKNSRMLIAFFRSEGQGGLNVDPLQLSL